MPAMKMEHFEDPAEKLRKEVGPLADVEVFNNQVLVAIYLRPEKTASGLYLASQTRDEDRYQSKVGLVLKKGPEAFIDEENRWFRGVTINEGDWIVFRPSDGWQITINPTTKVLCRMMEDVQVRGRIGHPDQVW